MKLTATTAAERLKAGIRNTPKGFAVDSIIAGTVILFVAALTYQTTGHPNVSGYKTWGLVALAITQAAAGTLLATTGTSIIAGKVAMAMTGRFGSGSRKPTELRSTAKGGPIAHQAKPR